MKKKIKVILNNVYHLDCFDFLKKIKSESVDLIATDPPYEISYHSLEWDKISLDWSTLSKEFSRVLKPNGSLLVFQGWSCVSNIIKHLDKNLHLQNWIIYDRIKGRGTKKNLVSTREDILWYVKDKNNYTYNKIPSTIKKITGGSIGKKNGCEFRAMSNVWTDISPIVPWSKEKENHPTQKPLKIMERIVTIFSNEGDLVIDPFMGSGTTAVASKKLKRNYIATDTEKSFYDITIKRLNEYDCRKHMLEVENLILEMVKVLGCNCRKHKLEMENLILEMKKVSLENDSPSKKLKLLELINKTNSIRENVTLMLDDIVKNVNDKIALWEK